MRGLQVVLVAWLFVALPACSSFEETGLPLRMIWKSGRPITNQLAIVYRGAVDEAHFYTARERIGDDRAFVAYNRESGEETWRSTITGPCSPPVTFGNRVYCAGDKLFAFDADTGRSIWMYEPPESLQLVTSTADAERVYVGTPSQALAVDSRTGILLWSKAFENDEWSNIVMRSVTLSPEGDLLIAFQAEFVRFVVFSVAVIVAVDPTSGQERWRYVDGDRTTDKDIGGLTIWEDLMLYSGATGKEAVAVSRTTRQVVWRSPFAANAFSSLRPPLVEDGVAYFTDTQGNVFAVDARTGRQRWRTKRPYGYLNHEVCGSIVYGDDTLGDVLDRATGKPLGRPLGTDDVVGQEATADGVLYISAESGVYAFDCSRLPK